MKGEEAKSLDMILGNLIVVFVLILVVLVILLALLLAYAVLALLVWPCIVSLF